MCFAGKVVRHKNNNKKIQLAAAALKLLNLFSFFLLLLGVVFYFQLGHGEAVLWLKNKPGVCLKRFRVRPSAAPRRIKAEEEEVSSSLHFDTWNTGSEMFSEARCQTPPLLRCSLTCTRAHARTHTTICSKLHVQLLLPCVAVKYVQFTCLVTHLQCVSSDTSWCWWRGDEQGKKHLPHPVT